MRRLFPLLIVSSAFLFACGGGGGSNGSGGGATPSATHGGSTRTPTRTGGPTRTPTRVVVGTPTRTPTIVPGSGQTLYVRPSGSDDNPGTSPDTALKTVAGAVKLLAAGTTVYVGPGRYTGRVEISGKHGSGGAPILLIADSTGANTHQAPGQVILDAAGDIVALLISKSTFVTADGFVITGAVPQTTPKAASATAVEVRSAADHTTIRNCIIGNSGEADGIRVDGSSDVLIFDNLVFENSHGIAITGDTQRAHVINNTIANNQRTGIVMKQKSGIAPSGTTLLNNIIQGNQNHVGITVDLGPPSSFTGYVGNYNLVFEPGGQGKAYSPPSIHGSADVNTDALFLNVGQGDVHLGSGSPALNAGTNSFDQALVTALFKRSTTEDGGVDKTPLDMGYHYPARGR